MNLALSSYLDLTRFGAAVVVALSHAWPLIHSGYSFSWPGHAAVVMFFVLSGLVIAYAVDGRDLTLGEYTLHRVARVWSVAIPALLLSVLVALATHGRGLTDAAPAAGPDAALRIGANLLPLGQIWFFDIDPPLE